MSNYDWHEDTDGKISDDDRHGTFQCVECGFREFDHFYFSCGLCRSCKLDKIEEARRGEADYEE